MEEQLAKQNSSTLKVRCVFPITVLWTVYPPLSQGIHKDRQRNVFYRSKGLAISVDGTMYFADGPAIRSIDSRSIVRTLIGSNNLDQWTPVSCSGTTLKASEVSNFFFKLTDSRGNHKAISLRNLRSCKEVLLKKLIDWSIRRSSTRNIK